MPNQILERLCSQILPPALLAEGERASQHLLDTFSAKDKERLLGIIEQDESLGQQLLRAIIGSQYLLDAVCRDHDLLFHWLLSDAAFNPITPVKIFDAFDTACSDPLDLAAFDRLLRQLRRRFITGIYWRDLNQLADFREVSRAVTALAEASTQQALDYHYRELAEKSGTPMGLESQQAQPILVIGMGKLGGDELNVSSDIDLIFIYPESGSTDHKKPMDNQKFFTQLGQRLIKSLSDISQDGFVFRVDMRLRPYGQSGALVCNFNALENYYQTQGRDWERFASIKARVIACSQLPDPANNLQIQQQAIDSFEKLIQPFTYRKYIDFSLVESLRQLKMMIVQEVKRRGLKNDIKLGAGGIREIEFIVQSFQLIRGGHDRRLQEKNLLSALSALEQCQNLSETTVSQLKQAYIHLRNLEHRIQAWQDKQTQSLPENNLDQQRLAWLMGFSDWHSFNSHLEQLRQGVSKEFESVIAPPEEPPEQDNSQLQDWQLVWADPQLHHESFIKQQAFTDAPHILSQLQALQVSRNVVSLSSGARDRLDQLMPQLLAAISHCAEPDQALSRMAQWLESIVTRTHYLTLMLENPQILQLLVNLLSGSAWITATLSQTPSLLDELLNTEYLLALPSRSDLQSELRQRFLRIEVGDEESAMETLRYFRLAHNFHTAASEVTSQLPLMKVSDYLSFTAEVVLEKVLQLAWEMLVRRHGVPNDVSDPSSPRFLIVGYGKLGGLELSYSSDLDLVFIYETDPQGMTNGDKPLDNQTFYTRLGQKIIHILNTRTLSGSLYEVDMRLRPSGNSGLLVSSIKAYARYQSEEAWTWEHQALVRARPIAGQQALAEKFQQVRRGVLEQEREIKELKQQVIEMRQKMRVHLGSSKNKTKDEDKSPQFHLKQDQGGVVDIEFMVQYAVLAWGHKNPALSKWTDNIRILETMEQCGLLSPEQTQSLITIYQSYRKASHYRALQQEDSPHFPGDQFVDERRQVQAIWQDLFAT